MKGIIKIELKGTKKELKELYDKIYSLTKKNRASEKEAFLNLNTKYWSVSA